MNAVRQRNTTGRLGSAHARFEIGPRIGAGGMGEVYEAWDRLLERRVALKLAYADESSALLDEARAQAGLEHPNVVRVYGLAHVEGRPFVVMEYVDSETLEARMRRERLSFSQIVHVVTSLGGALEAIHAAGRIHGDVKPGNVLIERRTGRVVLADFGLSRRIEGLGATSTISGTPDYLAPECLDGREVPAEQRAARDVYALASLAFELITGVVPYEADDLRRLLYARLNEDPPAPSQLRADVGWPVDHALLGGLERDPGRRCGSARRFAGRLMDALRRPCARPRILLADDDDDLRAMVTVGLARRLGPVVIESAADGESAYRAAVHGRPDAVILDLNMPGLNGMELAASLRARPECEDVPLVVVSGQSGSREREILRRIGVDAVRCKPVPMPSLAKQIAELLHLRDRGGTGAAPRVRTRAFARTLPRPEPT